MNKFDVHGTFYDYQLQARKTAVYNNKENDDSVFGVDAIKPLVDKINQSILYLGLGICSEAGEIGDKLKKIIRDKKGIITEQDKKEISKEIGDCQWYLANLATELNLSLQKIASENLEKLESRMERNKISGSGDDR